VTLPAVVLMSAEAARECVEAIRQTYAKAGNELITLRQQLLSLYEGEGWRPLGYGSWRECVTSEFEQSQRRVYQLLTAAKIDRQLQLAGFVPGTKPATERQYRALAAAPEDARPGVWDEALQAAAPAKPTARQVQSVADRWAGKVTRREEIPAPFAHVSGPILKPSSGRRPQAELPLRHCPTCTCEMEPEEREPE